MRILALDVGTRRIGIAVSDALGVTARPHSTIERNRQAPDRIASLVRELEVTKVLIGLPLHLDGTEGKQANDVRLFAEKLTPHLGSTQIEFRDERLTSVEAEHRLQDRRVDWRNQKLRIDAVAAAVLLEDYLREQ